MITESVKCGRCGQWFKMEILEDKEMIESGEVDAYLCRECDDEIKREK